MGRAPYYGYLLSDAVVKMGGPLAEEEDGQLLILDRRQIDVKQD